MDHKIKVVQYGLGPIGNRVTQYLVERDGLRIVGGIDSDPEKVGLDVGALAGLPPLGVRISGNSKALLSEVDADVVALTTTSSLERIQPQVMEIVSCGMHVVSTCEELAYPWRTHPKIAREMDEAAKAQGVSVLGTGVNPGFLMDFLPLALTGVCRQVKKVTVERIQNAQFRRLPFQKKIGAGLSVQEFREKVKSGTLRHMGLTESMHMIAAQIGWMLDKTEDTISPVIADHRVSTEDFVIEPGEVLGVDQIGRGCIKNQEVITIVFRAAIGEPEPRDRILIEGSPDVELTIQGGINGDIATCAIVVNAVPAVIRASAGLRTMADIEPISCFT
jgi:4-hydroxy-tetrahydrodipicolinate reductase